MNMKRDLVAECLSVLRMRRTGLEEASDVNKGRDGGCHIPC